MTAKTFEEDRLQRENDYLRTKLQTIETLAKMQVRQPTTANAAEIHRHAKDGAAYYAKSRL